MIKLYMVSLVLTQPLILLF